MRRKTVGLDLIAGVSLAAFVIPESLAYTSLARLLGAVVVLSASTWLYFNAEHIRRQIVGMIDGAPAGLGPWSLGRMRGSLRAPLPPRCHF